MADIWDGDYRVGFHANGEHQTASNVLAALNSIAAKDAEIERLKIELSKQFALASVDRREIEILNEEKNRLRAAVKPKVQDRYKIVPDGTDGYNVFRDGGDIVYAWFYYRCEAEQYVRDHQPKPVLRWMSRDATRSDQVVWGNKPEKQPKQFFRGDCSCTVISLDDLETLGIPTVQPGECHCYSVLDGVWTRVDQAAIADAEKEGKS